MLASRRPAATSMGLRQVPHRPSRGRRRGAPLWSSLETRPRSRRLRVGAVVDVSRHAGRRRRTRIRYRAHRRHSEPLRTHVAVPCTATRLGIHHRTRRQGRSLPRSRVARHGLICSYTLEQQCLVMPCASKHRNRSPALGDTEHDSKPSRSAFQDWSSEIMSVRLS